MFKGHAPFVKLVVCNHKYSIAALLLPPLGKLTLVIFEGVPAPHKVSSDWIFPPSVIWAITVTFTSTLDDSQPALDLQLTK
jgi:hypothetical protein